MEDLKALKEARNKIVHDLRGIIDKADEEKRAVTPEERGQFDTMETETSDLDKQIEEAEQDNARAERLREREERLNESETDPIRPDVMDNLETREERETRDIRSTPEYEKEFSQYLKDGTEVRALQADVDIAGGFTIVPQQFVNKLIKDVDDDLPFRQYATVYPLEKAGSLGFPELRPDADDAVWGSEIGSAPEESTMGFQKREMRTHPLSLYIKVSNPLIENSALPIESLVSDRLRYKSARKQESAFMTGTGANQPLGVMTNHISGLSTACDEVFANSNVFDADTLIDAKYALKPQYHRNARWFFHRFGIKAIRKLKDGEGNYIWRQGLTADRPDTILDLPLSMSELMSTAFSSSNYGGIVGDFSHYWIAEARDIRIKRLTELFALTDQTAYIVRSSIDGAPVLREAFRRLRF